MASSPVDPSNSPGSSGSDQTRLGRRNGDGPRPDPPAAASLRGHLLVAGRQLRDPNFHRTLVLMVEHGEDGAFGLVVNRPSDTTVERALAGHLEVKEGGAAVFDGGPVEPAALFVLHNSADYADGERPVCPGVFVGNSRESFEGLVNAVDAGEEGTRYRVFSGCAGWGPGQLEDELQRADWRIVKADAVLGGPSDPVFGPNPYDAWEAVERMTTPSPVADHGGDFRMN
ncbi:MAG: YqgE/AlgH family protein [Planctomycetota bacterium]